MNAEDRQTKKALESCMKSQRFIFEFQLKMCIDSAFTLQFSSFAFV